MTKATRLCCAVCLIIGLTAGAAPGQTTAEVLKQVRYLLDLAKETANSQTRGAILVDAEAKAKRVREKVDPRNVEALVALCKVAWYFGETQALTAYANDLKRLSAAPEATSTVSYLLNTPQSTPTPRPGQRPPVIADETSQDKYDTSVSRAEAAEAAGALDEARQWYYLAHRESPAGPAESKVAAALLRLTVPIALKHLETPNYPEASRLVNDYLREYRVETAPNEAAVYIAMVSARHLQRPKEMEDWARTYVRFFPQGPHHAEVERILGEVNDRYFDSLLVDIRVALSSHTEQGARDALAMIEQAEKVAVVGKASSEFLFLRGVYHALAPEAQYDKAREAFKRYIANAPNGRFVLDSYKELQWLDQPLLLFAATEAGGTRTQLWTIRPDGSDCRSLSTLSQGEIILTAAGPLVAISPSGDIAYATSSEDGLRVFVQREDGSAPQAIWASRAKSDLIYSMGWAPRANEPTLKFHAQQDGLNIRLWTWKVGHETATAIAQSETRIADNNELLSRWSPDGTYLAWRNAEGTLWLTRVGQETSRYDLTAPPRGFDRKVLGFVWTQPTLRGAAPVIIGCTSTSAFKIDLQPGSVDAISRSYRLLGFLKPGVKGAWQVITKGAIAGIGCSSDGDSVAFLVGPGTPDLEIYRVNTDSTPSSGPPVSLSMGYVRTIGNVNDFEFSPLGARLAFRTSEGVFISRFDALETNDRLVDGTLGDTQFFWSPRDGQLLTAKDDQLAVTYDRGPLFQSFQPSGAAVDSVWANPQWSPDSRIIAIEKGAAGGTHLILSLREATMSRRDWTELVPAKCQTGTFRLIGWLSSIK